MRQNTAPAVIPWMRSTSSRSEVFFSQMPPRRWRDGGAIGTMQTGATDRMTGNADGAAKEPIAADEATSVPDVAWTAALRSDDEGRASIAFTEIYTCYRQRMIRYGYRTCRLMTHEAADAAADVFARFWERRRALRIADTVERYLLRAMANGARDHRRAINRRESRERHAFVERELAAEDDRASADQDDLITQVASILHTLPRRQQLVIQMRVLHNCSVRATAAEMRVSANTVRADLRRAIERFHSGLHCEKTASIPTWSPNEVQN
jgi:RNA polymerase sigma factor (sigma-70 family)